MDSTERPAHPSSAQAGGTPEAEVTSTPPGAESPRSPTPSPSPALSPLPPRPPRRSWSARIESALVNRDHARLWYGQTVSTLGDYVFDTTVVLWVATVLTKGRSWSPAAVSGIMIAVGAAVLVVGPAAGVFVDRWNRRATMLASEAVRAVLVAGLAALSFVPVGDLSTATWLAVVYAVVFVVNAVGQFFAPARMAVVGEIVPELVDRTRATGADQAAMAAAGIIGPPLAAPLLFTAGLQWALILNAASYVFSYAAVRSVRLAPHVPVDHSGSNLRREFAAGLRFFTRSKYLVTLLTAAVLAQCGTGALNALDIFFVTGNLHTNARFYGFLSTAAGLGAICGALVAGTVVRRIGAKATTWVGIVMTGLMICLYARQVTFWSGALVLFFVLLPVTTANTAMMPHLMRAAPSEYLGRVMAVFVPTVQAASLTSVAVAGWLASTALNGFHAEVTGVHIGRIDTIFTVSGFLVVLAGLFAAVRLPGDEAPAPTGEPVSGAADTADVAPA